MLLKWYNSEQERKIHRQDPLLKQTICHSQGLTTTSNRHLMGNTIVQISMCMYVVMHGLSRLVTHTVGPVLVAKI